ncbi:Intracellular sulfur oxidation protein, DsrE/DsrF family [Halogranum amylolyticum]|uniref:Intracellular sulfur oxidation protein, DsrE/DsrF family n=1 Tax=Halogranum amylolyticum TaxID=660520 RepID=A0A1H8SK19_9EURY|nr:DsrE family protein [Halogranum amylolyticum]SEO79110.1 Intracellular sulfur oxidation protein, DsrE/DsrF family [Halogranum amylolyticum]
MSRSRRRFLELAGVGTGLVVAGCTGSTDGSTETATSPTTDATTQRPEETETNTPESEPTMSTVFHFASDVDEQNHAVANVANLLADESTDVENVVLVANGRGIELLTESGSEEVDRVRELLDEGVSFRACENSMKALDVDESELIDGVETVPAGVGELTKLQVRDDYAYIETP